MNTNFSKILVLLVISFFLPATLLADIPRNAQSTTASTPSPKSQIESTINELVRIYKDETLKDKSSLVKETVNKVFDFEEMARRSLGSSWKKFDKKDKQSFVKAFSDFLATTYLNRIEKVEKNMVQINSEQIRGKKALVRTKVTLNESTFPIDYKLHNKKNPEWSVYDVIIENVGLVNNYRNEFSSILRNKSLAELTNQLIEKTKKISK